MIEGKKSFNSKSFVAIVMIITSIALPITGLILHLSPHGRNSSAHSWLEIHVLLGILFTVFACWHIFIHRKQLLLYMGITNNNLKHMNQETRWAVAIIIGIMLLGIFHNL